jgi:hypothetical protein
MLRFKRSRNKFSKKKLLDLVFTSKEHCGMRITYVFFHMLNSLTTTVIRKVKSLDQKYFKKQKSKFKSSEKT